MSFGDFIVIAVILVAVGFAVRSLIKAKKNGGCAGNCSSCGCNCCSHDSQESKD